MFEGGSKDSILFVEQASLAWDCFLMSHHSETDKFDGLNLAGQTLPDSTVEFLVDEVLPLFSSSSAAAGPELQCNLSCCGLSVSAVKLLATALAHASADIVVNIDLSFNGLTDSAMFFLASALSTSDGKFKLNVSGNALTVDGVVSLLNPSLTSLVELQAVDIKMTVQDGAITALLADTLLVHPSLRRLQLSKAENLSGVSQQELLLSAANNVNGCCAEVLLAGADIPASEPAVTKKKGDVVIHQPEQVVPAPRDHTVDDLMKENAALKQQLEAAKEKLNKKRNKRKLKSKKKSTDSRSASEKTTSSTATSSSSASTSASAPKPLSTRSLNTVALGSLKQNVKVTSLRAKQSQPWH